ncbi:MAG TPA: hypothetical protein VIQ54_11545 [Polyangia bacterium]
MTSRLWFVVVAIAIALAATRCGKDVVLGVAPGSDAAADAGIDATSDSQGGG